MLAEFEKVQIVNVSNRNLADHLMKGIVYASCFEGAAADSPLVSRTSFRAVSCDFSTVDISTAQALLFESAG